MRSGEKPLLRRIRPSLSGKTESPGEAIAVTRYGRSSGWMGMVSWWPPLLTVAARRQQVLVAPVVRVDLPAEAVVVAARRRPVMPALEATPLVES